MNECQWKLSRMLKYIRNACMREVANETIYARLHVCTIHVELSDRSRSR